MRLLGTILILLALSSQAHGAKSCLSHAEAKRVYKGAYLYWSGGPKGQRCWSNQRGKQKVVPARALIVRAEVPREIAKEPIHVEPTLQWQPQWDWIFQDALFKPVESGTIYSTFSGEEPEVWPALPPPEDNRGGLIIVMTCGAMAMVFGVMFVRWHSTRVRIT
jgi:hypothetical protein